MGFTRNKNIKKTKTDHVCFGCMKKIPIGSEAWYSVTSDYRYGFSADYFCVPCWEFINNHPDWFEDYFSFGDVIEARREYDKQKNNGA